MGTITVATRARVHAASSGGLVLDVTSHGPEPWVRFSPFYPHGGIPIPFSPNDAVAASVEGVWQGLKVFRNEGIDIRSFANNRMRGLKRAGKSRGPILGHQKGLQSRELLSYGDARQQIYLPTYKWVLEHKLRSELEELRRLLLNTNVTLLDFNTSRDVYDLTRPLSHAVLVKLYVMWAWPADAAGMGEVRGDLRPPL